MGTMQPDSRNSGAGARACCADWFCVHTHPKHEPVAAANLTAMWGIEVWNPRIEFNRGTRRGPVTVTESVFPGYLFARFDLRQHLDEVRHTAGVAAVVHFGTRYPIVPASVIEHLKEQFGVKEVSSLTREIVPGEQATITAGSFRGLEAVVLRTMPGRQRVQVLVEILGTCTPVELDLKAVSLQRRYPRALAAEAATA